MNRNRRKIIALAYIAVIVFVPAAFALIPTTTIEHGPTLCLFKLIFGIECPGCGMTRAVSAVMHGNIAAAIEYNPLVLPAFPLLVIVAAKTFLKQLRILLSPGCDEAYVNT
ncbi:MAG TPA: DUF2752 domain-containing protein [bacterium]|nr:DUF2752 domain-containing protein [bacterium]